MDPVEQQTVDSERQRMLEATEAAVKRAREALGELEEALRVSAVLKRSRDSLKDLLNAVRLEKQLAPTECPGASVSAIAEQRLRSIIPVNQPLMLCSQVQRSGGTLLTRLFDGHPACFVHPSELGWGRAQKRQWPSCDLAAVPNWDDLLAQLEEGWPNRFAKDGYHKFSKWTDRQHPGDVAHYPFVFDATLQGRVFAAVLDAHRPRSQRDVLNAYLTSLFNAWLDYQNLYREPKRWVTAFTPRLILRSDGVDRFFADYPDGLLVTIVREPGAWFSSFKRHVGGGDPQELVDVWIESAEASLRAHATRPESVVVVLFEDLVHRTELVMRRLSDRMDIPFADSLLDPTYNSMPVLSDSSHELVAGGIDPAVTSRHHATLASVELDLVSRVAAPRYDEIRERFAIDTDDAYA